MQCFYVNDRKIFSDQSFSVSDLLVFLNLNIDLIVIEYNKIIVSYKVKTIYVNILLYRVRYSKKTEFK